MCFNQPMTFGFSLMGLVGTIYVYKKTRNVYCSLAIFYFFLMEFLQGFQYFWVDQCDLMINKVLTIVGLLHIVFQPYFAQLMIYGGIPKNDKVAIGIHKYVLNLCLLGAGFLICRFVLGIMGYYVNDCTEGFGLGYNGDGDKMNSDHICGASTEWVRGNEICTYSGRTHIAWSLPMASVSYYMPSAFLHFFLMFSPYFLAGRRWSWVNGLILMVTGPILAAFFTDDLMEQPAIWCFFSMCQVCFVIFLSQFDPTFFNPPHPEEEKEDVKNQ